MIYRPEKYTKEYKRWVSLVIRRCKGKCVACDRPSKCAHHINGWNWCYALRYEPTNGVILCTGRKGKYGMGCHNHFHQLCGYGFNTEDQLRGYLALYHNKNVNDYL